MMSVNKNLKKKKAAGLGMMAVFVVVLVLVFMPIYSGHNGLDYLDKLFNSISKGSAYHITGLKVKAAQFKGKNIKAHLTMPNLKQAEQAELIYKEAGLAVDLDGNKLAVSGDLGALLTAGLADADAMYHNQGQAVSEKYAGQKPRAMLYAWWVSLKSLIKDLNRQEAFGEAKFIETVQKKAVEMSYNYYGIEPASIGDQWGVVLFSLVFYVLYTLWYGFGVMYLFEGTGYQLESH